MSDNIKNRAQRLGLYGVLARWDELADQPWLPQLIAAEEEERHRRGLERRLKNAHIGRFKPMADFDWAWPTAIDRAAVDDLFHLDLVPEGVNVIFVGPNGTGKTMIVQNLAYQAILSGRSVLFTTASAMLNHLAAQDGSRALQFALRRYCSPAILAVDEVGYLSYGNRHADLLFEVVTRRYEEKRPILVSTNKAFGEWNEVFPNAACVVTLVDRLIHRSEIVHIEGESYRLKEAKERAERRKKSKIASSGKTAP
jgi:DNA replication protein DnaC